MVTDALENPVKQVLRAQLATDLFRVDRTALVARDAVAIQDEETGRLRQGSHQRFRDSVGHVVLTGIAGEVPERQDNKGREIGAWLRGRFLLTTHAGPAPYDQRSDHDEDRDHSQAAEQAVGER
jgi:hypothetical protein